jgi:hypothetical protein
LTYPVLCEKYQRIDVVGEGFEVEVEVVGMLWYYASAVMARRMSLIHLSPYLAQVIFRDTCQPAGCY